MNIAIAGYGVEGRANLRYWGGNGNTITILDEHEITDAPDGIAVRTGAGVFDDLSAFDMVVRTASLNPARLSSAKKVWSATNEFFAQCRAPIIGVTGTKGKGTTASLAASILKAAGKNVHLVGNIGVPALDKLPDIQPDDIVVFELSSFQLGDAQYSPHVAVVLMIEPDHLNIHSGMQEYVNAKATIVQYQTAQDIVVFNKNYSLSRTIGESSKAGVQIEYPYDTVVLDALQLPGRHNRDNACAAIAAVSPWLTDPEIIRKGLASFTGLPHRLKLVAEKNGVEFYDDSIATTPGSAIAALQSFSGSKVIILGGTTKGAQYDALVNIVKEHGAKVVAIGDTGREIAALCAEHGIEHIYVSGLMDEIVPAAASLANGEGVVLLSPAATSFGQYTDYADRGEQFIKAVEAL